jgi:predicted transcriptional regulator
MPPTRRRPSVRPRRRCSSTRSIRAPALAHPAAARHVQSALAQLVAGEIERRTPSRRADAVGLLIANLILAHFGATHEQEEAAEGASEELVLIIYVTSFMTPAAIRSAARDQMQQSRSGTFPAAVSARESLASDEYIVSMIDGKPYRSLARHIARFGMTPERYRECFSLPPDYPMVAKAYSLRRSELARRCLRRRSAAPAEHRAAAI